MGLAGQRWAWAIAPVAWLAPQRKLVLPAALGVVFALVVMKAAGADMTWDEAWTYLFYGRSLTDFLHLDTANDHLLNSFFIAVSTRLFGNSELAIRLPNVLAAGLYLGVTARLIGVVRCKLWAFALCVMQPYLLDYFALARGYGLAAALLQLGLVEHFFVSDRGRYRLLLSCGVLASLAVTPSFIVLYALIASHVATMVRRQMRDRAGVGDLGPSLLFAALGLAPVAALLWVSRPGLPLVGARVGFFRAVPWSVAHMYVGAAWCGPVAVLGLLAIGGLCAVGVRRFRTRTLVLLLANLFVLAGIWLAALVSGKPLPSDRVLIPFVPLWDLGFIAIADDLAAVAGLRWAGAAAFAVIGGIFVHTLDFQGYRDWPQDRFLERRLVRALVAGGCLPQDVAGRYGQIYYRDRWFGSGLGPALPPCAKK